MREAAAELCRMLPRVEFRSLSRVRRQIRDASARGLPPAGSGDGPVASPQRRRPHDGGASSFAVYMDLSRGTISLVGRLDGRSAHLLYDAVSAMLQSDSARRNWTVDVAELSVADHAGLRAIGRAYRRALRHDRRITLQRASPALQRALTRVHLMHHVLGNDGPLTAGGQTEP